MSSKDEEAMKAAAQAVVDEQVLAALDVDYVALSFVREAEDVLDLTRRIPADGPPVIVKIEKGVALDTELTPDLVTDLLAPFSTINNLGVVSPKIYYYDEPQMIQYAGYTAINPCTARNSTIGQFERDHGQYDQQKPTPYAHGAAMMVKPRSRKMAKSLAHSGRNQKAA